METAPPPYEALVHENRPAQKPLMSGVWGVMDVTYDGSFTRSTGPLDPGCSPPPVEQLATTTRLLYWPLQRGEWRRARAGGGVQ
jgi:hypothetical protein